RPLMNHAKPLLGILETLPELKICQSSARLAHRLWRHTAVMVPQDCLSILAFTVEPEGVDPAGEAITQLPARPSMG
ncbi:hypothetical protein, partial [Mesorhizobium sp. M0019]|uniref:hypothetical protein n=1 Tax=Mesorhizobium sp. M0019 TaxID=2956845 RepID=UPI00333D9303